MAGYTAIANLETGASARGKLNTQFTELFGENAKAAIVVANAAARAAIPAAYLTAGKIVLQLDTMTLYSYDGVSAFDLLAVLVGSISSDWFDFNLDPTVTMQEGRLAWDKDAGTLMLGMPGGDVNLQIGQEMHMRATNDDATTHTNGTVVYISGSTGSNIQMKRADANVDLTAQNTIAIATEDVTAAHKGYYTTFGIVRDVNTLGMTEGDPIYLSETAGAFTQTPPAAPANRVRLGYVIIASATVGQIFVKIDATPKLGELPDTTISTPADGDILRYDGTNEYWMNDTPKFGDVTGGDYSEFEADGTLKFNGAATVWNDLILPASNLRPGASAPTFAAFLGGVYSYRFDAGSANELHGAVEIQHDYKEGSDLFIHVHWSPSTTNTGNIVWGMEYTVQNVNGTFGAPTTVSMTPAAAPGVVARHVLSSIGTITGTGLKIGAIVAFRVFRQNGGTDTFTGNAFLHSVGIHYESDTAGSRQIATK